MKRVLLLITICSLSFCTSYCQLYISVNKFIASLDSTQKAMAVYSFDNEERYNFHFFPKDNRKGLMFNDMNVVQKKAAWQMINAFLSDNAVKKVGNIMEMEKVLKQQENRKDDDHTRDPGKYFITIFGVPGKSTIWGWRLEGHHITFNFSSQGNKLLSGSPGFMGSNPSIVESGPLKGRQILKEEADNGFHFLHSLSSSQLSEALVDTTAPGEIITFVNRKVLDINPAGIKYSRLKNVQQQELLLLIRLYVNRYTKLLADKILKEIEAADLNKISFAWAGYTKQQLGKPHYYRIQGPTFIIEYDNSQNNANHVHTVFRDLNNDFGGDELMEHYKSSHSVQSK